MMTQQQHPHHSGSNINSKKRNHAELLSCAYDQLLANRQQQQQVEADLLPLCAHMRMNV